MGNWVFDKISEHHSDVYDHQKLVGTVELGIRYYHTDENKKGLFNKRKKLYIKQVDTIFRDVDHTVEVKSSCHLNQSTLMYDVFKRTFTYTKDGKKHEFEMIYHNQADLARYYYSFEFNSDTYYVFFDNRYFNLELFKNKDFVGKWEQTKKTQFTYEVETFYEEHKWLWFSIFSHLYSHFPRASSNYFIIPDTD
ncbi:hypothetical protein ACFYKX_04400 [Cytobacillus sp. FJAT-54145]|uniref:Uncharacterized protein n=1 Tax=Cytobacillus spartinae TaxID=3299023 RepID=A0ABW6K6T1_9BACI